MTTLYLIALLVGGAMLLISLFGGGDAHHDDVAHLGHGGHGHHDGHGHGHGGALDLVLGWLPITSLRFWLVFAAFFGLTGTVLTLGDLAGGEPIRGLVAGGVGYLAGVAVVATLRRLGQEHVSSGVGVGDLVGATAAVLVPVARGAAGKVRVRIKDRAVDLVATTDDATPLAEGRAVVVFEVAADGAVRVTGEVAAGPARTDDPDPPPAAAGPARS